MINRKILFSFAVVFVLVTSFYIYFYYFSLPTKLPSNNVMMEQLNEIQDEIKVKQVQDKIFLNNSSLYVPFISEDSTYGSSYWVWSKRKWRIAHIEENDAPRIWKIKPNDPNSYHFVWNFHPKDKVKSVSFYLLKERYYLISEGLSFYEPRVQLNVTIPSGDNSFGTSKIPGEWITTLKEYEKVEANSSQLERDFSFHWMAINQDGHAFFPETSLAGSSSSASFENETIEHVIFIDEHRLE